MMLIGLGKDLGQERLADVSPVIGQRVARTKKMLTAKPLWPIDLAEGGKYRRRRFSHVRRIPAPASGSRLATGPSRQPAS